MEVVLNIGLARTGKPNLNTRDVIATLQANGFWPVMTEVFQSDTEPTLVVVAIDSFPAAPYRVAYDLQQDCIAIYRPATGTGDLLGPRSHKWGAFNPEFFIMPDGTRLASPAAKAA